MSLCIHILRQALIWSKKSSGLPITIRTAHSTRPDTYPSHISTVVLDIDIAKNEPRIISTRNTQNHEKWRGVDMTVTVCGNWSNYRSRVLQYFQQLAVITPYAELTLQYNCIRDDKKNFTAHFIRRSDQMPPIPIATKPHPKSLNNITLSDLLRNSNASSLAAFLNEELSGFTLKSATSLATSMGLNESIPKTLTASQIAALCQVLLISINL
jgi:DNA topoisomerase VI subunit B